MRNLLPIVPLLVTVTACGSSDDTGERFGPSDDCLAAIACASAVDPDNASLYEGAYGQDADCWADADDALECTRQCQAEIDAQAIADPTEMACWPGDTPEARWLFAARPVWQFSDTSGACQDATGTFSATAEGPDFSFSLVFQGGDIHAMQCSLDAELAFACEQFTSNQHEYVYSGTFADDLSVATLDRNVDGALNCVFRGVPGVG